MKLVKVVGATSEIWQVFVLDSTVTTGAGKTGIAFNAAGLKAYYHRDTDTTATSISLVTMTVGTFTSGGWAEIDATNMPGWYQFCPPNTALATGAKSVAVHIFGATAMQPVPIEVQLTAGFNLDTAAPAVNVSQINAVSTSPVTTVKAVQGLTTADTIATYTGNTPQTGDAFLRLGAPSGASVSADIAEIEGETDTLITGVNVTSFASQAVTAAAPVTVPAIIGSWDEAVDGTTTARQSLRLANSANGGKLSGAATTTVLIRDLADTKNRVTATVDADGNRTVVTTNLT